MIFRLCFCCFGFDRKSSNDVKHLLAKNSQSETIKSNEECYTVHKISSFGRAISNDEDAMHSDSETTVSPIDKTHIIINKNNAVWSTKSAHIQNAENEIASDLEESIARTPQGSPVVKKRGHWGKVLLKTKRETKNPTSFQSLASVSMMMLPTITVAESSASVTANLEGVPQIGKSVSKKEREVKSLSSSPQTSNNWLKSQSMQNVNCLSDNESNVSDKSTNNVAKKYGLDTSLYDNTHLSKSTEAINRAWKSMEDFMNDNGFVDLPNGAVHFFASYNKLHRKLLIRIVKIEGLAPKGIDRKKYNCIVKLTILPHEKHVKYSKTIAAHSTLNLDERFIFSVKDPLKKVLRISVYDAEFQGKYDAVGHSLFYIEDSLINDQKKSHVMKLYRQSIPDIEAGSIKIILNYDKETQFLNLFIDEAYNLPPFSGKCKSYLKLTHHHMGRKIKEIYSSCISAAQEVRYKFTVDLKIDYNTLQNNFIVISVKIKGFLKKDVLVGRVILGPYIYAEYGKNLTPWGRALVNKETVSHVFRMYL